MPTVPRYSKPAVEQRPIPDSRTSTDLPVESFGGGRGLERATGAAHDLLEGAMDIYANEKRKADEIAIRDADIATAELANDVERGVKNLKGKDAAGAADYANEAWQKGMDKIAPTLKNDNQRIAADRISRARRLQLDDATQVHMASEFKRYDNQQFQSAIELYRNEGSMKYNRPNAVANSIFQQESEIDRYGERNNLPPEWMASEKAKARSATYRDVLERMEVDGNHALAKEYEKGVNKYILPDDVAILDKVRREEKVRKAEMESEFERQSYLLLKDSTVPDAGKIQAIDNLLRAGKIKLPMAEKMKGWVLDTFNDSEIPVEKKVSKYNDLVTAFTELDGVKTDKNGHPVSAAEGNDLETISKFRQQVAASKRYLTKDQYSKMIELTEADYDAARAPKKNMFESLRSILPLLPSLAPAMQLSLMQRGMEIFDKKVTPQQAADTVTKLKEEAVVAGNPRRAKYVVGQRVTNPQGIDLEVVGYDEAGNPRFKVAK